MQSIKQKPKKSTSMRLSLACSNGCTHHWKVEPADRDNSRDYLLAVCLNGGGMRIFKRGLTFKYPTKGEYALVRKVVEMEEWLDTIAPRHTDAQDQFLSRRRQAMDWYMRRQRRQATAT